MSAIAAERACKAPQPSSPLIVDVKSKGARGDGASDDTASIQAAIDEAGGTGGTVLVPAGTYSINAEFPKALKLRNEMTLKFAKGAVLKAMPTAERRYVMLYLSGVHNVTVIGGLLQGEREQHRGTEGDAGIGLRIDSGASNITVNNVTAKEMWGDGFLISYAKNITLCGVVADRNRRQGLTIAEADGVLVTDSVFQDTGGVKPGAGIDLEPDERSESIANVRIQRSRFFDNQGAGILINGKKGPITNVEITNNVFRARRPIMVKDATTSKSSAICGNRYVAYATEPSGLYAFGDPVTLAADERALATFARGEPTAPCGKTGNSTRR
jgi:hypothetical protein